MLYLKSVSDLKNIPFDAPVINIARKPISGIHNHAINLAPSAELLNYYLSNRNTNPNWFDEYKIRYSSEIKSNPRAKNDLLSIESLLKKDIDVYLICYCKDYIKCHRRIIGSWFSKKGYSVSI